MITIKGVETNSSLSFYDDVDETMVLEVSAERATVIASWDFKTQYSRLNGTNQKITVHLAKDFRGSDILPYYDCDFCDGTITEIDTDFHFHSLPWCKQYRRAHDTDKK